MMDDNDDLYFSFDEEPGGEGAGPAAAGDQKKGRQSNRTFLIAVIALAAISLLGIGLFVAFIFLGGVGGPQVSANELTNQANMTLLAATQVAQRETQSAPTATPTEEAPTATTAFEPTATPTSLLEVTAEEVTAEAPGEGTEVAEGTTPTPLRPVATPTGSGIIEVTPLGGTGEEETSTGDGTGTAVPGGVGGPITPQSAAGSDQQPAAVATLPQTGFAGTAGLAGAGILAVALAVVAIVARRIRLK